MFIDDFPSSGAALKLGGLSMLVSLLVLAPGCMPERVHVMNAAENQANRWLGPMGCGLGGEQSKYLEQRGEIHEVLICGHTMLCKKDDVATRDGYTCVARGQEPESWRRGASSTSGPQPGTERGPCYGNNTCNQGLTCASNVCVKI